MTVKIRKFPIAYNSLRQSTALSGSNGYSPNEYNKPENGRIKNRGRKINGCNNPIDLSRSNGLLFFVCLFYLLFSIFHADILVAFYSLTIPKRFDGSDWSWGRDRRRARRATRAGTTTPARGKKTAQKAKKETQTRNSESHECSSFAFNSGEENRKKKKIKGE